MGRPRCSINNINLMLDLHDIGREHLYHGFGNNNHGDPHVITVSGPHLKKDCPQLSSERKCYTCRKKDIYQKIAPIGGG
ncbi:hypothetical protein ACSQ67_014173 [Phaseolus vulgaris]